MAELHRAVEEVGLLKRYTTLVGVFVVLAAAYRGPERVAAQPQAAAADQARRDHADLLEGLRAESWRDRQRALDEFFADPQAERSAEETAALVNALVAALADPDPLMRGGAAGALALVGPAAVDAGPHLVELLADEDAGVRRLAMLALGDIHDESAGAALVAALKTEEEGMIGHVLSALAALGTEEALPAIAEMLAGDGPVPRRTAFEAVGAIGGPQALDILERYLEDPQAEVRGLAAAAVGDAGGERAVDLLKRRVRDTDGSVRSAAIRALGETSLPSAVEFLVPVFQTDAQDLGGRAYWALVKIGEIAIEPVSKLLEHEDPETRRAAASLLSMMDLPAASEATVPLLADPEPRVRAFVASAFKRCPSLSPEAHELLLAGLNDDDPEARKGAIQAFQHPDREPSEQVIDELIRRLSDPVEELRWEASVALGDIGMTRAPELMEQAKEFEPQWARAPYVPRQAISPYVYIPIARSPERNR